MDFIHVCGNTLLKVRWPCFADIYGINQPLLYPFGSCTDFHTICGWGGENSMRSLSHTHVVYVRACSTNKQSTKEVPKIRIHTHRTSARTLFVHTLYTPTCSVHSTNTHTLEPSGLVIIDVLTVAISIFMIY